MSHSITQPRPYIPGGGPPKSAALLAAVAAVPKVPKATQKQRKVKTKPAKKEDLSLNSVEHTRSRSPAQTGLVQLEDIVLMRVNEKMNEYIACKFPETPLLEGSSVNISSLVKLAKYIWVGVAWDCLPDPDGDPVDLDVIAFCMDQDGACQRHRDMVYWGNPTSSCDALSHVEGGDGQDMETVKLEFYGAKVAGYQEVALFLNIRDAHRRQQCWASNVKEVRLRIYDKSNGRHRVLARLQLCLPFLETTTTVELVRLKLTDTGWSVFHQCKPFTGSIKQIFSTLQGTSGPRSLTPGTPHPMKLAATPSLCWGFSWVPDAVRDGGAVQMEILVAFLDQTGVSCENMVTLRTPSIPGAVHRCLSRWGVYVDDDTRDQEVIDLNLTTIPSRVYQIVMFGMITPAYQERGFTLADISDISMRLFTEDNGVKEEQELCRVEISRALSQQTCAEFGRLVRQKDGSWGTLHTSIQGTRCNLRMLDATLKEGRWMVRHPPLELRVGQSTAITAAFPALTSLCLGLGWTTAPHVEVDIDLLMFAVGSDGKVPTTRDFVYFNNPSDRYGTIQLRAPNNAPVTPAKKGMPVIADRQVAELRVFQLRAAVRCIHFIIIIAKAPDRRQTLTSLKSMYLRLFDAVSGTEICRQNLNLGDRADVTALELGRLKRSHVDWVFHTTDEVHRGGLVNIANHFRPHVLHPGELYSIDQAMQTASFSVGWDQSGRSSSSINVDVFIYSVAKDGQCCLTNGTAISPLRDVITGAGEGVQDEKFEVCFQRLDPGIAELVLLVAHRDANPPKGLHLGQLAAVHIRHFDRSASTKELFRFEIDAELLAGCSAVEMGRLKRDSLGHAWSFLATGTSSTDHVADLFATFRCPPFKLG